MTAFAYYNEIDPYAAQWLRNLIAAGYIANGYVDERPIQYVQPYDLKGFTQCHFFAGIGIWSAALRRAGWPDHRGIWTGSCPCQPFSSAGKGLGFADERHLWPAWFHLITQCEPERIYGEQVSDGGGPAWIDLVSLDLEMFKYAFGAIVSPVAGIGAPHLRHRVKWMADAAFRRRRIEWSPMVTRVVRHPYGCGTVGDLGNATIPGRGFSGRDGRADSGNPWPYPDDTSPNVRAGPLNGFWRNADWIFCNDPKGPRWRPVEAGTFPMAHGNPARMGRLRAYGNAINLEEAAIFIKSTMEACD